MHGPTASIQGPELRRRQESPVLDCYTWGTGRIHRGCAHFRVSSDVQLICALGGPGLTFNEQIRALLKRSLRQPSRASLVPRTVIVPGPMLGLFPFRGGRPDGRRERIPLSIPCIIQYQL